MFPGKKHAQRQDAVDLLKGGVAASGGSALGRGSEGLGLAVISLPGRLTMLFSKTTLLSLISSQCAFVCHSEVQIGDTLKGTAYVPS